MNWAIRSSVNAERDALSEKLRELAAFHDAEYSISGIYPAWEYKKDSHLRDVMCDVYKKMYGKDAKVVTIHAGLECGIFSEKLEGIDCVSIGPQMHDIHTSRERLEIGRTYKVGNNEIVKRHSERHYHCAENHEGRAQKQAERKVDGGLHLIDVTRQTRDEGRCSHAVGLRVRELLNMRKQIAAQVGAHTNGGTRCKILGDERTGQSHSGKGYKNAKTRANYTFVTRCNAIVNNGLDNQRYQKIKNRLKELEEGANNAFLCVGLQIFEQFLHARTSFLYLFLNNYRYHNFFIVRQRCVYDLNFL